MTARKIELPVQEIADLCRRYGVRELAVFGSYLRDDFRPDSDIDLLVDLLPEGGNELLRVSGIAEEVTELLALVTRSAGFAGAGSHHVASDANVQALGRLRARAGRPPGGAGVDQSCAPRARGKAAVIRAVRAVMSVMAVTTGAEAQPDAARQAMRAGRYEEAIRLLQPAVDRGETRPAVLLGDALSAIGRLTEAEQAYRRAAARSGSDSLVAALRLAELKERGGDWAGARRDYRRFISVYNTASGLSSEALAAVAEAVRHLGREDPQLFQDALRAYDQAVRV